MYLRKPRASSAEKALSYQEQQTKVGDAESSQQMHLNLCLICVMILLFRGIQINEVRCLLGQLAERLPNFCSDASILRYLRARNWDVQKSGKMLKETLKWRLECKPETIRWVCTVISIAISTKSCPSQVTCN